MGAITIAFDTIIAGALALPWLLLVVHLFFPNGEQHVADLPRWIKEINQPAALAVILFALTYLIGSAVSRTAQDFSNDDDLHLSVTDFPWHPEHRYWKSDAGKTGGAAAAPAQASAEGTPQAPAIGVATKQHLILRVGMSENRVLAAVYCDKGNLPHPARLTKDLAARISNFGTHRNACEKTTRWHVRFDKDQYEQEAHLTDDAENIFGYQESALLLQGEDATLRLRQLHDQVMVLRSASFNGLIAGALCLFAWGARLRRERPRSVLRWLAAALPAVIFLVALVTVSHHFEERPLSEPPYMEFSLFVLAGGGAWLLWLRPQPAGGQAEHWAPCRRWLAFSILSILLAVTAALAWWSSEVAYTQQVIYAYDALPLGK